MHEILSKNLLCQLTLSQVLPKHDLITDFLDKKPLLGLFEHHKLLIKVFELVSENATHIVGPLGDELVGFGSKWIDDELVGERLTENVHEDIHDCGFGELLGAVVKAGADLD